jgi:NADH dehydrogenase
MHRVVVIGGGFGGIRAVQRLRRLPVQVTLIDRRNFHLFQPLSYQVATGALSPGEVAYPLRALFRKAENVRVLLAEVTGFDLDAREVKLDGGEVIGYDTLVVGAGSSYAYFGHDEWREAAAEVKSLESALTVRSRILAAFERAERAKDPDERAAELTFVIVGGGPTGVEMAGQIGELARDTFRRDFRAMDPTTARVLLVEGTDRILLTFPPSLSNKARRALEQLGVTVVLNRMVVGIDEQGVTLQAGDSTEHVASRTVIWAAGVTASGLGAVLAELSGAGTDKAGRIDVDGHLGLPGHPEVLALGDMTTVEGKELPGVAPVAIQQGLYAGRLIADRLAGRETPPFRYRDKGNLATIGRGRAVADFGFLRVSGPLAWMLWLGVHIWYLIGFQNRLLVLIRWAFSFWTRGRGARLITDESRPSGRSTPP